MQFILAVDCAYFRYLRNIDSTRYDHVLIGMTSYNFLNCFRGKFARNARHNIHFMSSRFNGSCFVHVDVTIIRRYDRFIRLQQRGNANQIRVCSTGYKVYLRLRFFNLFSDQSLRFTRERICHIAPLLLKIGTRKRLQNPWMGSFRVIIKEKILQLS